MAGKQMGIVIKRAGIPSKLSESEALAILIYYHYHDYKCFAYFHKDMVSEAY